MIGAESIETKKAGAHAPAAKGVMNFRRFFSDANSDPVPAPAALRAAWNQGSQAWELPGKQNRPSSGRRFRLPCFVRRLLTDRPPGLQERLPAAAGKRELGLPFHFRSSTRMCAALPCAAQAGA